MFFLTALQLTLLSSLCFEKRCFYFSLTPPRFISSGAPGLLFPPCHVMRPLSSFRKLGWLPRAFFIVIVCALSALRCPTTSAIPGHSPRGEVRLVRRTVSPLCNCFAGRLIQWRSEVDALPETRGPKVSADRSSPQCRPFGFFFSSAAPLVYSRAVSRFSSPFQDKSAGVD